MSADKVRQQFMERATGRHELSGRELFSASWRDFQAWLKEYRVPAFPYVARELLEKPDIAAECDELNEKFIRTHHTPVANELAREILSDLQRGHREVHAERRSRALAEKMNALGARYYEATPPMQQLMRGMAKLEMWCEDYHVNLLLPSPRALQGLKSLDTVLDGVKGSIERTLRIRTRLSQAGRERVQGILSGIADARMQIEQPELYAEIKPIRELYTAAVSEIHRGFQRGGYARSMEELFFTQSPDAWLDLPPEKFGSKLAMLSDMADRINGFIPAPAPAREGIANDNNGGAWNALMECLRYCHREYQKLQPQKQRGR